MINENESDIDRLRRIQSGEHRPGDLKWLADHKDFVSRNTEVVREEIVGGFNLKTFSAKKN